MRTSQLRSRWCQTIYELCSRCKRALRFENYITQDEWAKLRLKPIVHAARGIPALFARVPPTQNVIHSIVTCRARCELCSQLRPFHASVVPP
eukprot:8098909-Pyramimonas_sp.AAC.1